MRRSFSSDRFKHQDKILSGYEEMSKDDASFYLDNLAWSSLHENGNIVVANRTSDQNEILLSARATIHWTGLNRCTHQRVAKVVAIQSEESRS